MASNYESQLYSHVDPDDGLGSDVLIPASTQKGEVNIHYDYCWTLSEKNVRDYVPYVELTEYKMVLSSEISGFFYNLAGYADNVNVGAKTLGTTLAATKNVAGTDFKTALSSLQSLFGTPQQQSANITSEASSKVAANMASVDKGVVKQTGQQSNVISPPYDRVMNPYNGLYAVQPTTWRYIFPFLTGSNMVSPENSWGDSAGELQKLAGGILGRDLVKTGPGGAGAPGAGGTAGSTAAGGSLNIVSLIKDMADLSRMPLAATAGATIQEKPKAFLGTNSDSVTISFYLFNTQNYQDIQKNWEFCYLFTYQNLPNRKGINLLDPPCLYRVLIPGYKQLPLCYVSALTVSNVGAVKLINITTGHDIVGDSHVSNPNIKMVPEAYKVSMTLSSVLLNARNIFSYSEDPSKNITVTVASGQSEAEILNSF